MQGQLLKITFDTAAEELIFTATVLENSWFAIGFGSDMFDIDMIVWNSADQSVLDVWSTEHDVPQTDTTDNLTTSITAGDGVTIFETRRKLDTGDSQDYVVQLDRNTIWCYALRTEDGRWDSKHDEKEVFGIRINSDGTIASELDTSMLDVPYPAYFDKLEIHGWVMWSMWFVLGLTLLISKRYATGMGVIIMHMVHFIAGWIVVILTLLSGSLAIKEMGWPIVDNNEPHGIFGLIVMIGSVLMLFTGVFVIVRGKENMQKPWDPSEQKQRLMKFHRIGGYITLFFGNFTVFTGNMHFSEL